MRNNKGAVWAVVLVVVVAVVVVALIAFGGLGFGGGAGDGEGDGNITADEAETEETLPVIEEIEYVEITVSGKDYLYNNAKYTLDELIEELKKANLDLPVKITDDKSSLKAYSGLKDALGDNNIRYIEAQ
ncbi:MAG: hypothetical protein NC084_12750 [Bacteroides sp.]|nr:hypothetical protein [Eubacterium sp.]MCM1419600.1 hypothetical protein [Roseburia sp.]MCM1463563.1 hypothetical protein [Bacteroides sp.]